MSRKDDRLDQLLARGSLGGPRYDEILERVLERTEGERPRPSRRLWRWSWVPVAALAPVVALLVVNRPADQGLRMKGEPVKLSAAADVSCGPSAARVCRAGDVLMFTVNTAVTSGYLGAFAERLDDPMHDRIWYFPDPATESPVVAPSGGTVVVPKGIRIGPEHRPGRYRITVWIANRPLDRREVDAAASDLIRSRSILDFEVVP